MVSKEDMGIKVTIEGDDIFENGKIGTFEYCKYKNGNYKLTVHFHPGWEKEEPKAEIKKKTTVENDLPW